MEGIRMIGMSICVTAAVTALFSMLVPDSGLEKVLKFAIGLFFLTSLAAPFASGKLNFQIDAGLPTGAATGTELTESVESAFSGLASRKVAAAIEKLLLREGYEPKKVEVGIHITGQNSVSINQMRITIDSQGDAVQIGEIVKREVGFTPEIAVE